MDDFLKTVQDAKGDNFVIAEETDPYVHSKIDVRYNRKVTTVTSAKKVTDYKVKQWPTLSDDENKATNALGISISTLERRRRQLEIERIAREQQAEKQAIEEANSILDEELDGAQSENKTPLVTVEELDRIRNDAYEEGLSQGRDDGYKQGLEQGLAQGQKQGYDKGFEEGQKKGYDSGFAQGNEDGFVKGHNEGLESGQQVVLEQSERFRYLSDCLANPLREVDRDVTDELAYIVSRLVKVITCREIERNAPFLQKSIEKAVSILPNAQKGAEIYLNPEDLSVVETTFGREYIKSQKWDLKEDPSVSVGDIKVTNSQSEINWKLNDRIDALLQDFLSSVYPCVDKAFIEPVEGCPDYDETPKKPVAPRVLSDIAPTFVENGDKAVSSEEIHSPDENIQNTVLDQEPEATPLTEKPDVLPES